MKRLHALDGLRGVLALGVVGHHLLTAWGSSALLLVANLAVMMFFVMSGYVLAIGYDRRPLIFLGRRLVRLWPVYALCLVAGSIVARIVPSIGDFLMRPPNPFVHPVVNLPDWSPYLEIWSAPLLLWLGQVSYSLYLSHWVVIQAVGPAARAVLVLPVAWLVWLAAEQPSIVWSRRIGARPVPAQAL